VRFILLILLLNVIVTPGFEDEDEDEDEDENFPKPCGVVILLILIVMLLLTPGFEDEDEEDDEKENSPKPCGVVAKAVCPGTKAGPGWTGHLPAG